MSTDSLQKDCPKCGQPMEKQPNMWACATVPETRTWFWRCRPCHFKQPGGWRTAATRDRPERSGLYEDNPEWGPDAPRCQEAR